MTMTSYPFEGQGITEEQFSRLFREFRGTGICASADSNAFEVTLTDDTHVSVAAGFAIVQGFAVDSDAAEALTLDTPPFSASRIDRIVLRMDMDANSITLAVVKGADGDTNPPAVTQTDTVYDMPIAYVKVTDGNASVVTDERPFNGLDNGTWDTVHRPTSPRLGQAGFNTTIGTWEFWNGSTWSEQYPVPALNEWADITYKAQPPALPSIPGTPNFMMTTYSPVTDKVYTLDQSGTHGFYSLDMLTGALTTLASPPSAYAFSGAGLIASRTARKILLVYGGSYNGSYAIYDIDTNTWSSVLTPSGVTFSGSWFAALDDGRVFMFGGSVSSGVYTYRYYAIYDLVANTVTQYTLNPYLTDAASKGTIIYNEGNIVHVVIAASISSGAYYTVGMEIDLDTNTNTYADKYSGAVPFVDSVPAANGTQSYRVAPNIVAFPTANSGVSFFDISIGSVVAALGRVTLSSYMSGLGIGYDDKRNRVFAIGGYDGTNWHGNIFCTSLPTIPQSVNDRVAVWPRMIRVKANEPANIITDSAGFRKSLTADEIVPNGAVLAGITAG